MKNKLVIFGCGGHSRAVLDVILNNKEYDDILFVDDNAKDNEKILSYPIYKDYNITNEAVFVAIGNNSKRKILCKQYYNNLISIISKDSYLGQNVSIGKGVFIGHDVHLGIFSKIGDFSIINTRATIDHECTIEEAVFVGPNSTLCGKVQLGKNVFIGAGCTIKDNIVINNDIVVGAGAVVIKELSEKGSYIGIPAKKGDC